jgi:hypothetical protein
MFRQSAPFIAGEVEVRVADVRTAGEQWRQMPTFKLVIKLRYSELSRTRLCDETPSPNEIVVEKTGQNRSDKRRQRTCRNMTPFVAGNLPLVVAFCRQQ